MGKALRTPMFLSVAALTIACTAACATAGVALSGEYAYGTEPSELARGWVVAGGSSTTLDLDADGTFTGMSWPEGLKCLRGEIETAGKLFAQPASAVSGEWSVHAGQHPGSLPTIQLRASGCEWSPSLAFLWRNGDDELAICLPIDPRADSDNFTADRTVAFAADGQPNTGAACFS
jgi:hypothetical protein